MLERSNTALLSLGSTPVSHDALLAQNAYLGEVVAVLRSQCAALKQEQNKLRATFQQEQKELQAAFRQEREALIASFKQEQEALIASSQKQIRKLEEQNLRLVNLIKKANARTFGARSEKVHSHQLSLFNDISAQAPDEVFEEAKKIADSSKKPPKKRKPRKKIDWSKYDVTVIEHVIAQEDATCEVCGETYEDMGYDIRHVVHIVPAHAEVEEHRTHKYRCKSCCEKNQKDPEGNPAVIVRAEGPIPPLDKSPVGSTLLAHVLVQKYVNAQPIARITNDLTSNLHLPFSRQTLCGWVIKAAQTYIMPLVDLMAKDLCSLSYMHCDESTVQVLKEPGRSPTSKSWMWLFASAAVDDPIFIFQYDPHRSKEVPQTFLSKFKGTIITDGYSVYNDLGKDIRRSGCMAHARRYFLDALKAETPKGQDFPTDTPAAIGFAFIERIYAVEKGLKNLTPDKRLAGRKKDLAPLMDAFTEWAEKALDTVPDKSAIKKALSYALREWPHLRLVLEDGSIPIDNSRAERQIRPFCCGRKMWLFSDTPHGAKASAAIYSLITTACANGLNPYAYLTWLFDTMPAEIRNNTIDFKSYLPYAATLPDHIRSSGPYYVKDEPLVDIDPHAIDDIEEKIDEIKDELKTLKDRAAQI